MSLKVYNTLTRQKEDFVPLVHSKISMYVCGVTTYDYCHIGHARSAMVFDVIRSYFEYKGYTVRYIKNITDVDDKIIKRALQDGVSAQEMAQKYVAAHDDDLAKLGIRPATMEPKATEHIADMLRIVKVLVDKGLAYPVDGDPSTAASTGAGQDVYFSVRKFADYGKLSGKKIDELQSGARVDVDERKQDPLDFALWKASKPGEPAWESPWGKGRPGWHIECSAMSSTYLGDTFDIHGGGQDLIFPHHENEIAQSEAYSGKPLANYWLHNGMLRINKEKMSKSLGNFFTIRDVLEKYSPETIRFLLLSTHYRSPLEYSDVRLTEAATAVKRFYHTFNDVESLHKMVNPQDQGAAQMIPELVELPARTLALKQAFEEHMDDDFNTAAALGVLFEMLKAINAAVKAAAAAKAIALNQLTPLKDAVKIVKTLGAVLRFAFTETLPGSETERALVNQLMSLLLQLRQEARAEKNWKLADRIRDGLLASGIQIKDHPGGESSWEVKQ